MSHVDTHDAVLHEEARESTVTRLSDVENDVLYVFVATEALEMDDFVDVNDLVPGDVICLLKTQNYL